MEITYVGPQTGVTLVDKNSNCYFTFLSNETRSVPDALGERCLEQKSNWELAKDDTSTSTSGSSSSKKDDDSEEESKDSSKKDEE